MKHLFLAFLLLCALAGSSTFADTTDFRWRNYFGIGGSLNIEDVPREHTALHMHGSVARRIFPHVQLTLNLGYYPFGDSGTLIAFGDSFEIVTIGIGARINSASKATGTNGYILFNAGSATLETKYTKPYYCAGVGVENQLGDRFGIFVQSQYLSIKDELATIEFINLSVGVAFSPL